MPASLQTLPVELVESIVCLCDVKDIGSLRHASRTLRSKASTGHYQKFFMMKRVDLELKDLVELEGATRHGGLPSCIQHLTITGIVYNTSMLEEMVRRTSTAKFERIRRVYPNKKGSSRYGEYGDSYDFAKANQRLSDLRMRQQAQFRDVMSAFMVGTLVAVFRNLRQHGRNGGLRSLKLDMAVYRDLTERAQTETGPEGGDWEQIWAMATTTLSVTLASLVKSGITVESLDFFSTINRCSVAANDLTACLQNQEASGLTKAFSNLRSLSLSLSHRIIDGTVYDIMSQERDELQQHTYPSNIQPLPPHVITSMAYDKNNFTGVATLLSHAPQLEVLSLHWHTLGQSCTRQLDLDMRDEALLQHIVYAGGAPRLRNLSLRGPKLTSAAILELLRHCPQLQSLEMVYVQLKHGTFATIFASLSTHAPKLTHIHLDELRDPGSTFILFDEVGAEPMDAYGVPRPRGPNALFRSGSEAVARPIKYHYSWQAQQSLQGCQHWLQRQREYGPPQGASW